MKRLSFFLSLVITAALGSVFVASAQDPDEGPAPPPAAGEEAPADDAPDAAPDGDAPDAAPDDAPPSDDPPTMAPSPGDAPAGEAPAGEAPAGEAPAGEAPAGETPAGEAPAEAAPAAPTAAAPKPKAKAKAKSSALSSLSIEEGNAQLERTAKAAGAEPRRATLNKGQRIGMTDRDTALFDAESSGLAKFGGCQILLSENTTFKVLSVGEETSTVEILGVELELDRGTILEAAFGSLSITQHAGRTVATGGATAQVVQFNFQGVRYTLTIPAQVPGQPAPAITIDNSGAAPTISIGGAPIQMTQQPLNASGQPVGNPTTSTVSPGSSIQAPPPPPPSSTSILLTGTPPAPPPSPSQQQSAFAAALQQGLENAQDAPPAGTTPGTKPASGGL